MPFLYYTTSNYFVYKTSLNDIFGQFARIDIDARGGYARVFKAISTVDEYPAQVAFKILRHELHDHDRIVKKVFNRELSILRKFNKLRNITNNAQPTQLVPQLYGSGFLHVDIANHLRGGKEIFKGSDAFAWLTGTSLGDFETKWDELRPTNAWLPFLIIELADFDASLYRRILANNALPQDSNRIKITDSINITIRFLDLLEFLHNDLRVAYLDWKPEHVFWNQRNNSLKLIDWNVYDLLENSPQEPVEHSNQLIKNDIRSLIGSTLYSCLTLSDFEDLSRPFMTHPKTVAGSILPLRYSSDNPSEIQFPIDIDNDLAEIVRSAFDNKYETIQEVRNNLLAYLRQISGKADVNLYTSFTARKNENLLNQLESAYYDGDFSLAIQLAHFLLEIEPTNETARTYLQKAESYARTPHGEFQIPKDAMRFYRRARSYVAARDLYSAAESLGTAIHLAKQSGFEFSQARKLLESIVTQSTETPIRVVEGKTINKPKIFVCNGPQKLDNF